MDKNTKSVDVESSSNDGVCFHTIHKFDSGIIHYYNISFWKIRGHMFRESIDENIINGETFDIIHNLFITADYSNYLIAKAMLDNKMNNV